MSRRPAADIAVPYTIEKIPFRLATSTLTYLPEAVAFIRAQLIKGVSAPVASEYARLTAKAIRAGYAADPERITSRPERTAVNAYWAWAEIAYQDRVAPVLRAFATYGIRKSLPWLRVGSIRPPVAGKMIPRLLKVAQLQLDETTLSATMTPPEYGWTETDKWTLHIPPAACDVHTDPCLTCLSVELDAAQVEVLAAAFEKAWGHRDPSRVPPECLLFGTPPREGAPTERKAHTLGRIVALLPDSALAGTIKQLHGYVTEEEGTFRSRLTEGGVDVVVLSRALMGKDFLRLLTAVGDAWAEEAQDAKAGLLGAIHS